MKEHNLFFNKVYTLIENLSGSLILPFRKDVVKPFLEIFVGTGNVTDHLVRRIAHFAEYSALGCALALQLVPRRRVRWQSVINCAFAAMVVALTDETIQIFSGRGSQVQDVWLDFAGSCTGILFLLIIVG